MGQRQSPRVTRDEQGWCNDGQMQRWESRLSACLRLVDRITAVAGCISVDGGGGGGGGGGKGKRFE